MLDRLTIERMRALAGARPIAVAVSGGGDSVALLHLLLEEFGATRLRALVVDHALRDGSRADANVACERARAVGVEAELLTLDWNGGPAKSQQAAARRARYETLLDAATRAGANLIALGHTADDQAETVYMRATAGSGWRGLAGMAAISPAPVWPQGLGVALARPLLSSRRTALRRHLESRGESWIEDPANANPAFERVRVRAQLAALEAAGFDPARLTRLAARLRTRVDALDAAASELIERAARFEDATIIIAPTQWRGDREARLRALSILTMAAAGSDRAPDAEALVRVESHFSEEGFRAATLGGVLFRHRRGDIRLERDPGALTGRAGGPELMAPIELPAGRRVVWDGRAALRASVRGLRARPAFNGDLEIVASEGSPPADAVVVQWLVQAHVRHLLAVR